MSGEKYRVLHPELRITNWLPEHEYQWLHREHHRNRYPTEIKSRSGEYALFYTSYENSPLPEKEV